MSEVPIFEKATKAAMEGDTLTDLADCNKHDFPVTYMVGVGCALCHIRELEARNAALERVANDVESLVSASSGVAGLHLNGDVAPWSDLLVGGRFEEWLGSLSDALKPPQEPSNEQ